MLSQNSNDVVTDEDDNQLLRDIEAISNALYFNKPPLSRPLTRARSRSVEKSRFDWKKPLRALSHIGQHRFDCCFYLNVHSVEGLVSKFDGVSLCVNWERKDEVLRTRDVRVVDGTAEFGESLMHRCCVYGSGSGNGVAKYGQRISMVCVSVVGMPGLDTGRHWVDLTRLLPLTLEDLVGLRSFGKWTTAMKLSGMAEGAVLNVSLGFSVLKDNSVVQSNNMSSLQLLKLTQHGNSLVEIDESVGLRHAGSVSSNVNLGSVLSAQPVELKQFPEVLLGSRLELSKSINYLYQKLDEREECDLVKSEGVLPSKIEVNPDFGSVDEENESKWEDIEFTVIEKGIELSDKEQLKNDQDGGQNFDASADERIDGDENGKVMNSIANYFIQADNLDEFVAEGEKELNSVCIKESDMENREAHHRHRRTLTTLCGKFYTSQYASEFSEQEGYLDAKENYKSDRMAKKSLSLDDIDKSVENNFFSFLGIENASCTLSSDADSQSPREKLLREFEKEFLSSDNFIFDSDANKVQEESGSTTLTGSDGIDTADPFDFFSAFHDADRDEKTVESLRERRKVTFLEDLETEDLMRKWGLNEKVFRSSPRYHSSGFGSPIELPPESPLELPPLGEGLCPYVWTKDGGQLRSMNPRLFRNAKNGARLVMQVSRPVVLPAELGSGIVEILQALASVGLETLSLQMEKLMPLDDIMGKRLQQVQNTEIQTFMPKQHEFVLHDSEIVHDACCERDVIDEIFFSQTNGSLRAGSTVIDMDSEYFSLEDLTPLAFDKIEPLLIEGLRIQSGMASEDAPSSVSPQPFQRTSTIQEPPLSTVRESDRGVIELLDLSLTLDEWLRLDAGNIADRDKISEHAINILAAHHAMCFVNHGEGQREGKKRGNGFERKHGFLPNDLMNVLRLQLRDPFRNFEPVGTPMLVFIHVERISVSRTPEFYSMAADISHREENSEVAINPISKFKIVGVNLAGLKTESGSREHWGTETHQRSGIRWLLASGLAKTNNYPHSKSKSILRASRPISLKLQPPDAFWSISSCIKGSSQLTSHVRNPDIVMQNGGTRLNTAD